MSDWRKRLMIRMIISRHTVLKWRTNYCHWVGMKKESSSSEPSTEINLNTALPSPQVLMLQDSAQETGSKAVTRNVSRWRMQMLLLTWQGLIINSAAAEGILWAFPLM